MLLLSTRAAGVASCLVLIVTATHASAQMFVTTGRDTLRGLPGLEVQIEQIDARLERHGLTRAAIRSDVIARLRGAGLTVYASQSENRSPAKPYLYVDVTGVPMAAQNAFAVALQVQLRQTLTSPVTGSNIVDAMSWDARTIQVVPATSLADVRGTIAEYVDHFVRDWRAVHR